MDVLVAGGHGQIALRLPRLLAQQRHTGRRLIRSPDHAADLEAAGAGGDTSIEAAVAAL